MCDLKDIPVLPRKFMEVVLPKNTETMANTVFVIYALHNSHQPLQQKNSFAIKKA